jgi:tetratricopeptide (TPR) repeat protein
MGMRAAACWLLLLCTPGLLACAPRPRLDPRPGMAVTADMARANGLVRAGCHACLTDALAIYERLAASGAAPAANDLAIDTLLLLALRERELGLGTGRSLEQAIDLADRRPPPFDIGVFRSVAEVQAWHAYGVSKERTDESMAPLRKMFKAWQGWRDELQQVASSDLLRAYYLLSLDCSARAFLRDAGVEPWALPPGAPPLLKFRAAVCPLSADEAALGDLLEHDPRFAEAHFFLGQLALGRGTLRTAERHLREALDAIPGLAAARLTLGHVYLAMEDIDPALEAYHLVNAAVPGQREAMLGEIKSLSYLARHEEAVAILDEMERLGTWYMGEVYYWRAWNRHRLRQYDAANDDVLAARSRMPMDGQVDKLAGFIALARNEVPRAEAEFLAAVGHIEGKGGTDCEARYYLGSARVMQRKWEEAAPNFEKAEPCYAGAQRGFAKRIEMIRTSDLPEERKARLIAAKERDIVSARIQEARSSFNAAVAYANLGDVAKARPFAERAAAHPDLAAQAKALLDRTGKPARAPHF